MFSNDELTYVLRKYCFLCKRKKGENEEEDKEKVQGVVCNGRVL